MEIKIYKTDFSGLEAELSGIRDVLTRIALHMGVSFTELPFDMILPDQDTQRVFYGGEFGSEEKDIVAEHLRQKGKEPKF